MRVTSGLPRDQPTNTSLFDKICEPSRLGTGDGAAECCEPVIAAALVVQFRGWSLGRLDD